MRTRLFAILLVCAVAPAPAALAGGFYVSGSLDGVFPQGRHSEVDEPRDPFGNIATDSSGVPIPYRTAQSTHPQAGGEVDAAAGYRFDLGRYGGLRAEGEFSFRYARAGDYTLQSLPGQVYGTDFRADYRVVKGVYQEQYGETANLFYDLPSFGFATPYLGGGVGYEETIQTPGQRVETYQDTRYATGSVFGPVLTAGGAEARRIESASSDDGTWLAEAGVSLRMTQHLSLTPAYRFSQTFDARSPAHLMRLGLRYSF